MNEEHNRINQVKVFKDLSTNFNPESDRHSPASLGISSVLSAARRLFAVLSLGGHKNNFMPTGIRS